MIKFIAKIPQGWQIISRIEPFQFPGGEVHLRVPENNTEVPVAAFVTGTDLNDYMALIEYADLVHSQGYRAVALIPYLPAARADRGHPFGAKAYADLINAANLDEVVCLDPHSSVMPGMINNLRILNSDRLIRSAVLGRSGFTGEYVGVIAPDQGAVERTERVAKVLGLPVFYAHKHRDFETGKLSGFSCDPVPETGRLLVVDDICDGGGTFLGLADAIGVDRERLTLWVSHGIFSGRANLLADKYGEIYTTDSHPGATREDIHAHVTPSLPWLMQEITVRN